MTKDQKLEAVLDLFKAGDLAIAYAKMTGALMAFATEEAAEAIYNYYIGSKEAN